MTTAATNTSRGQVAERMNKLNLMQVREKGELIIANQLQKDFLGMLFVFGLHGQASTGKVRERHSR